MTERDECMKMINVCLFRQICSSIHSIHFVCGCCFACECYEMRKRKIIDGEYVHDHETVFCIFLFFLNIFKKLCLSDITIWLIWILLFMYIFLNSLVNVHKKLSKRIQIIPSLFHSLNSVIKLLENPQSRQKIMTNDTLN